MSRCFPFPPPGYESRARSEHVDLLAKEKHKERKHKKEKKDKEKREGKEKKDKDRSKDKHKEKKDRKEKHNDKKKDKDKDKSRTSDDKRIEERIGRHEVELGDSSHGGREVQDSKFTEELGKRIRDEEEGATNSMAENFTGSIQRRTDEMGIAPAMGKRRFEMVPNSISTSERKNNGMGQPVDKISGSVQKIEGMGSATSLTGTEKRRNHGKGHTMDKPIGSMQEMFQVRCVATTEKESGANKVPNIIGTMAPNSFGTNQRKNQRMDRPGDHTSPRVEGISTATAPEKERVRSNNMDSDLFDPVRGRNDGFGHPAENPIPSITSAAEKDKGRGSRMAAPLMGMEQRRNDGMGGSAGKDMDNIMEGKKTRDTESDGFKGNRHFDGDRNGKKNKEKDKERRKEKEKEKEKMRVKSEKKPKEDNKPRDNGKRDMSDSLIIKPLAPHKDIANSAVTDGNINKRKDIKMNGFLHENVARPNKILRTSFSSDLPSENGRTLEPCQIARPSISPVDKNNVIALVPENKERKINGITESRPSSVDLRQHPVAVGTSGNEVRLKPPHADTKYLNQIYSVPKMEEWPDFDDQEWLFSRDDLRPKAKVKFETEETPLVWAEAMQIKTADVMALPYVIPY